MTMFRPHWTTRVPSSLFEQTQYDADQLFYTTFPAARDASYNAGLEQNTYNLPRSVDFPTLHDTIQPLESDTRNELVISGRSVSFRRPTQDLELSYPQLHFTYSKRLHPQQPSISYHQSQPSYDSPHHPIESDAPLYIPPKQLYHHQRSPEPTSQYIPQSHPSPVSARELVYQSSNASPHLNTDIQETVDDGHRESPRYSFRQLNRHMKPPSIKFANNCRLGVMRLNQLSDRSLPDSDGTDHCQSHPSRSEISHDRDIGVPENCLSPSIPPPTEFLLNLAQSPSIGLSSLPSEITPIKKPPLACLFCRGRKIGCGPPPPGSIKKTCNQCQKRSLQCQYPTESRRGMRKKKVSDEQDADKDTTTKIKRKIKIKSQ